MAQRFFEIFGSDKHLQKLPESSREFYAKNISIIDMRNENEEDSISKPAEKLFYYPLELLNHSNIHFVDTADKFEEMLNYYETSKPTIIGMDCEWK